MIATALPADTGAVSTDRTAGLIKLATAALCAMIAFEFSGAFGVLAPHLPVSPFVAALAAAGLVAVLRVLPGRAIMVWLPLFAMIGYLLAVTTSFLASPLSPAITGDGVREALNLALFTGVLSVLAANVDRWSAIALAVTLPMAAIALLGLANEFLLGNGFTFFGFETVTDYLGVGTTTARHAGPLPDPNFWARLLVAGLPLALALAERAWKLGRRRWAGAAGLIALLLLAGIYLTSSRGGFLAAGVALLGYLIAAGHGRWLLAIVPTGALALLLPGVGSRLLSFGDEDVQLAAEDPSVLSRLATQRVALAMIADRPLVGVGPDGYIPAFGRYAAEAGQQIDRVLAPHNLYLGLWAEVGLLGLLAFLLLVGVGLVLAGATCLTARRMSPELRARYRPYAAGLLAGQLAWCVAGFFLHLSYARVELIMVCLSAAIWVQARRVPLGPVIRSSVRPVLVGLGAALGALITAGALALAPLGSTATATGRVVPVDPDDSYLLSLRTRTGVIPTLAVVVGQSSTQPVTAQGDVGAGVVRLTASAETTGAALDRVDAAVTAGDAALRRAGLTEVFTVVWDRDRPVTRTEPSVAQLGLVGVAGGLAGGVLGLLGAAIAIDRRRSTG
ncbi:O-antigen ligase family protein [Microlunatus sp. GCM10028923]|uniref:O-antigen ligase family protein n=1 Tax=Microlunatus sp. GCM10028923 TaxID=3273400 RepID=UPI0036110E20